jgi:para-nitrobenzyl esterase
MLNLLVRAIRPYFFLAISTLMALPVMAADQVRTEAGIVEGTSADGIRAFKGIPYAAPPVAELRWKAPRPAKPWEGVRKADQFGARCMQGNVFNDMVFRDSGPSEDCLYLNVWTPAKSAKAKLPVMVWVYGGGFVAGATSEPRQDGTNLAKKGVVVVSMNYRLGVFGFLSHPELTKESDHNASGNYGLMDQAAALQWVASNIRAFGGDPKKVTILGESAGSFSVSALMASPLSRSLIQRAIGESGAMFSATLAARPLQESEKGGLKLAEALGTSSLDDLRAKSAEEVLAAATKVGRFEYTANIDGYFLPKSMIDLYSAGEQAHVPLMAGWNADEGGRPGAKKETPDGFTARARTMFGDHAAEFLKIYPANTEEEAQRSAHDLAGDQFIALSTWKWIEAHKATGKSPVYRYRFDDSLPSADDKGPLGAYHSAEIEFVFGNLASKNLPFRDEDRKLSDMMSSYWSNFAKTGNPNGPGLPKWPEYDKKSGHQVMHLDAKSHAAPDEHRARYEFLDTYKPKDNTNP